MAPRKKNNGPQPKILRYPESAMQDAIAAVREDRFKIREAARHYGVPHSTLINKLKCRVPQHRKMGRDTYFSAKEENLLKNYIIANAKKGIPLKRQTLIETVSKILDDDKRVTPFKNNCPGRKWIDLFLKRHPEITERKAEGISTSRAFVTADDLKSWHKSLKEHLENENVLDILEDPQRIFNADESGFQTCPESGKVLGPVGMKNFYEIKSGKEKEQQLTVMVTINAAGQVISPMIVYPLVRISREIATNVPENWAIGKSPKGWMTGPLYYEYVANVFDPWLKENNIKKPVLLLIDGPRSHLTLQVSQYCEENQIIAYALFPNSTHISQPADVSVFKCLKSGWKNTVSEYKHNSGNRQITRSGFAPLLAKVFVDKVTPDIVTNGFKRCGIYPFDVSAMDFTRCMDHDSRKTAPVLAPTIESGVETLLLLESFMRRGRAKEFRQTGKEWEGDESAKELFYVWKKFRRHCLSLPSENFPQDITKSPVKDLSSSTSQCSTVPSPSVKQKSTTAEMCIDDIPQCNDLSSSISQRATVPSPSVEKSSIAELCIADMPPMENLIPSLSQRATVQSPSILLKSPVDTTPLAPRPFINTLLLQTPPKQKIPDLRKFQSRISPSENTQTSPIPDLSVTDFTQTPKQVISTSTVQKLPSRPVLTPTASPNPSPSCSANNKLIQIVTMKKKEISPAFGDHILWPSDSPLKKRKTERLPFASGSKKWQDYWSAKDKEKEEKDKKAERRKKIRDEKKVNKVRPKKKVMIIRSDTESEEEIAEETGYKSEQETVEGSEKENVQEVNENFCEGDFVIFVYEKEHFVGKIESISEESALIKSMQRSLKNWKWPDKEDINLYNVSDIKEKIKSPQTFNKRRGFYYVPEFEKYQEFI